MPTQKIDHSKIAKELVDNVQAIEADSSLEQREKTIKFKAAAKAYLTALYKDGRKYRGAAGQQRQIALSTAQKYLSSVRSEIEQLGWRHHLLDRDLGRLKKNYPLHAEAIAQLEGLDATQTRLLHKSLTEQLDDARELLRSVESIDFSKPGIAKKIQALCVQYSLYEPLLNDLTGKDPQQAFSALEKAMREREALAADLHGLKINHEIMYHLVLPKEDAKSLKRTRSKALSSKKESVVAVHFEHFVGRIANMLSNPAMCTNKPGTQAVAPLTFAICAATGRRPIEVLIQGDFTAVSKHKIKFTGQAKKRFEEERDAERWFYSLVDSELVINAISYLRGMSKVQELMGLIPEQDSFKTANKMVNDRTSNHLNQYAREFFGDNQRTFKDTRGVWARIAFTTWFDVDPYWKSKDEDVFYTEMLGQQDAKVQMHYKPFKIHAFSRNYEPTIAEAGNRLQKLEALDDKMPELAKGDSAVTLHDEVKDLIKTDPNAKITQSVLTKPPFNGFRDMVKRYLETCADALEIELVGNRWKPRAIADQPPIMVEVELDDLDIDVQEVEEVEPDDQKEPVLEKGDEALPKKDGVSSEDKAPKKTKASKPKIGSYKNEDGSWTGEVELDDQIVGMGVADSSGMAQRAAWRAYEDSTAKMSAKKEGDRWHITITVGDYIMEELMQKGRRGAAEKAAWTAFKQRE